LAQTAAKPKQRRLPFSDAERVTEVNRTLDLIEKGGPFPYRQDGIEFKNRERRLPVRRADCYHEYTVRTPGAKDRGARRIITGCESDTYFTDDHYRTFQPIDPKRY
jgi:ribonuclease T1